MKIAVMGSGSIGGYLGARMAAAGAEVTFVARGAHLAAIRAHGLTIRSPLGDLQIAPATATDDPAAVGAVDVVLLATKLYDVEAAAQALGPMIGQDTAIVCLQNGIDAPDIVERAPRPDARRRRGRHDQRGGRGARRHPAQRAEPPHASANWTDGRAHGSAAS